MIQLKPEGAERSNKMKIENCVITGIKKISPAIISLTFLSEYFSKNLKPGQFLNIKVEPDRSFILRRPFSVSFVEKNEVSILFNIVGKGTFTLSKKNVGDEIDVLGPLGNGFHYDSDFQNAVIIGGGIGIAPFPFLIQRLKEAGKKVDIFFGYRSKKDIIEFGYENLLISTDDGSYGFNGNVNELFLSQMKKFDKEKTKIFACGPNIMLKNLSGLMSKSEFDTEVSIESYMACGIGICQGCPVRSKGEEDKYYLVCKDGPCFNIKDIIL